MKISLENIITRYKSEDNILYEALQGLLDRIKTLEAVKTDDDIFNEPLVISAAQHVASDFITGDATAWNVVGVATKISRTIQISKDNRFACYSWGIEASTLAATPPSIFLRVPGNYAIRANDRQAITQSFGMAWIFNGGGWAPAVAVLGDGFSLNHVNIWTQNAAAFAAGALWVRGSIVFPIAVNE